MPACFQDDNAVYLLLDYVAGGELFSHLRRSERFEAQVAKFYAAEVASAIRDIHAVTVVHRGLKPENILIAPSGHIRIIDFGFAKIVPDITYTMCG